VFHGIRATMIARSSAASMLGARRDAS